MYWHRHCFTLLINPNLLHKEIKLAVRLRLVKADVYFRIKINHKFISPTRDTVTFYLQTRFLAVSDYV